MSLGFGSKKNGPKSKLLAASTITNVGLSTVAVPAVLPATAKQMNEDIAKWSERKSSEGEAKEEHVPDVKKSDKVPNSTVIASSTPAFVCTLCRRQFTSGEQLLRHERESKLHAANLAKAGQAAMTTELNSANASSSTSGTGTSTAYRDRASERRAVHGQLDTDTSLLVPSKTDWLCNKCNCENFARRVSCYRCSAPISIANGGPVIPSEKPRQMDFDSRSDSCQTSAKNSVNEDLDNPGNQMLRRLGWKDGEGLGRGGVGDVETVAAKMEHRGGSSAVKSGVGAPSSAIPAIDYGARGGSAHSGETKGEYKNSIMRAAKARFDLIDSQKK